ncbi:phosphotransferase [Paenibacillus thermotolerans]|uniref:phosphotransferase n=1 Tax=Paenibacillus thermotolerans TaxID=3027807 RepID=UPI0023674215|nr:MULTISPECIES: phosphotransferase [unclassified Paenibacillus]
MRTRFRVDESALMMELSQAYGLEIDRLRFLPIGDSAYSYRVGCVSGEQYHLKLFDHSNDSQRKGIDRLQFYLPLTWRLYHEALFRNVTYPIRALSGDFKTTLKDCTAVLFHFIDGETLADAYPFSENILEAVGRTAARIHLTTPHIDRSMLSTETYDISFIPDLDKCLKMLDNAKSFDDPILQSLRDHVLGSKDRIQALLTFVRELRADTIAAPGEMVLCHGDLWGGNMIRQQSELYVLDWESAQLAPREFDMAGYIGESFNAFYSAYERELGRSPAVDPDILRFYCYRNHLRNLTNWLMNIIFRNLDQAQKENDLDMILHHCMNRWDGIEPAIGAVEACLQRPGTKYPFLGGTKHEAQGTDSSSE